MFLLKHLMQNLVALALKVLAEAKNALNVKVKIEFIRGLYDRTTTEFYKRSNKNAEADAQKSRAA